MTARQACRGWEEVPPVSSEEARTTTGGASSAREAMFEGLLKDLQKQVALLEEDLRERARDEAFSASLRAEHQRAVASQRTGDGYGTWLDGRLVQIAAAWVLACVFVRFSEDNGLIPDAWLSGPGERLLEAQDRHEEHFRAYPEQNDRDWLKASFDALADAHPTARGLFDERHNPMGEVTPSYEAAARLLAFWRERGSDNEVRYDFTDPELNTRFLGDLYQDLSEYARKTYALLQTPVFVEEFILDLTLEPAVEEFGLDPVWKHKPDGWRGEVDEDGQVRGLRCIDPACGSGHFLLGLFERILAKWRELEPGTDRWVLIRRALESVHGADKNPYAASIARFRLLVAALKAAGVRELRRAPGLPIRIAVGDSLLHGREAGQEDGQTFDDLVERKVFTYRTEDVQEYVQSADLLGRGSYHVVVANPPYITVKDKTENQNYRDVYWACSGKYALSVPFAQRIFELAIRSGGDQRNGGFTGQITSNSFMKREFGKVLIESFFHGGPYKDPKSRRKRDFGGVELSHIIDTSGAYIPGHGTPTVILVGRNQIARQAEPIRAVLGVRGEPEQPRNASQGKVWQAIVRQVGRIGSESDWVSVENAGRARFAEFPWTLSGGRAPGVMDAIERAPRRLKEAVEEIGRTTHTGRDEAYYMPPSAAVTRSISPGTVPIVLGEEVREYVIGASTCTAFPYAITAPVNVRGRAREVTVSEARYFWRNRAVLRERIDFGETPEQRGLRWFDHSMFFPKRYRAHFSIAFAFVATHNHFVLDRGGKVFNRTAPVIKLPEGATEEQHLELMGMLNSSAACFWLKQVSHDKGSQGINEGFKSQEWERFYEFTGTKLQEFPLPAALPLALARELDALAQRLAEYEPSALAASGTLTRAALTDASDTQERIRARMVLLQEELDWTVYGAYGLLTPREVALATLPGDPAELSDSDVPQLRLGERAFEIALKGQVDAGEAEIAWFDRHGSAGTATAEIPAAADWPEAYRKVVQARLDIIESNKDIRLLERPEYKRRWSTETWEKREAAALRAWLLDAAERKDLWFEERNDYIAPRTLSVFQLADALRHDEDVQAVAALYAADHLDNRDASLATVLAAIIETEHVPYLAALRYKESGLRKREQWEYVWEQQREEDRTGERLGIPVPPKYTGADFLKHSYWSNRGKLDVPKERFVSYPGASTDNDPSLLLGWAGWNHRDQAEALVNLLMDRSSVDGWSKDDPRFVPLLAGLQEIMPWVHQWYDAYDEEWGDNPAQEFQTALNRGSVDRNLSQDDLRAWRPEKKRAGRKKAAE
ncbi:BREX-2 system adenine-specific DNA-methyltransferase PglX [Streptomyces sp. NPDC006510]|uniref:BREX-2 system adenine-specific DNA-methyltransferase PglX n=1 Tax=Streptomyces sp. NPDC006510 TaxID=3155600 RepID=UPI0033A2B9DE